MYVKQNISSKAGGTYAPFGLLLMAAYMFFDGFTSTFQEKMFKGYTMSTYDQMIYVNAFSALISFIGLYAPTLRTKLTPRLTSHINHIYAVMLFNGTFQSALKFTTEYPQLMYDSTMLSVSATFGQMVIYYTIKVCSHNVS